MGRPTVRLSVDAEIAALVMDSRAVHDRTAQRLGRTAVPDRDLLAQCLADGIPPEVRWYEEIVVSIDRDGFTVSDGTRSVSRLCWRLDTERALSVPDVVAGLRAMLAEEGR